MHRWVGGLMNRWVDEGMVLSIGGWVGGTRTVKDHPKAGAVEEGCMGQGPEVEDVFPEEEDAGLSVCVGVQTLQPSPCGGLERWVGGWVGGWVG